MSAAHTACLCRLHPSGSFYTEKMEFLIHIVSSPTSFSHVSEDASDPAVKRYHLFFRMLLFSPSPPPRMPLSRKSKCLSSKQEALRIASNASYIWLILPPLPPTHRHLHLTGMMGPWHHFRGFHDVTGLFGAFKCDASAHSPQFLPPPDEKWFRVRSKLQTISSQFYFHTGSHSPVVVLHINVVPVISVSNN